MNALYRRPLGAGALLGRVVLGTILTVSGISKLMGPPEELAAVMDGYQLLPIRILMPFSHVLPWIEIFIGVCLLIGLFLRWVSFAAIVTFAVFIVALSSVIARGIDIGSCGCFGKWGPTLEPSQTLILDGTCFLLATLVVLDRERVLSLDRWLRARKASA